MEPPKHKHKKVPRAPADDPVPVLHSPPRKVRHCCFMYVEDSVAMRYRDVSVFRSRRLRHLDLPLSG